MLVAFLVLVYLLPVFVGLFCLRVAYLNDAFRIPERWDGAKINEELINGLAVSIVFWPIAMWGWLIYFIVKMIDKKGCQVVAKMNIKDKVKKMLED